MEFEMPIPCTECGEIFELHGGRLNPRSIYVVICAKCADEADKEYDMEIALETIKGAKDRLRELGVDPEIKKETQTQPDPAPRIRL